MTNNIISLSEFQVSMGIPAEDQICLLGKDNIIYSDFFNWNNEKKDISNKTILSLLRFMFENKFKYFFKGYNKIFLGRTESSFDNLESLELVYKQIKRCPRNRFILMIGKGDYEFNIEHIKKKPDNLVGISANNINIYHPDVIYFPMGRDWRSRDLFQNFLPCAEKRQTLYCNFSLNTHSIRKKTYDLVKEKKFINFQHMGSFLNYSISREEYFKQLSTSKFCVCPRGNAIDTFRMWDALYVGTIPIVVYEAIFHDYLQDLPILFIQNYDQFGMLTYDFLEKKYTKMLSCKYNYKKLKSSYWKNKLESKLSIT